MKKILILAALGIASAASAQSSLTLRECLEVGLEKNYAVRIVRNDERISDNNATRAAAGALPSVGLGGGYSGGSERTRTVPREGDAFTEKGSWDQAANAGLDASWTLFEGFSIRTNYERLKELKSQGAIRTRIAVEDFVASLTAEYYNYIQQQIRLENLRHAMDLSRERRRIVETRYVIGNGSRPEVLQARVDFNADSSAYMNQIEQAFASRVRLNEMMAGDDVSARLNIPDSMIHIDRGLEWNRLKEQTLAANAQLLAAESEQTLAELDLRAIRSRNYPWVNVDAGYGYNRNRFGAGDIRSRATLGPSAGLTLGYTLFDGNRRREQRNARIGIENASLRRQELELSLSADLSDFWHAYRNFLQILRIEEDNLISARENLEAAQELYMAGVLPGIEMRQAEQSLQDAEESILTTRYNAKMCEISLRQISGSVLVYLEKR